MGVISYEQVLDVCFVIVCSGSVLSRSSESLFRILVALVFSLTIVKMQVMHLKYDCLYLFNSLSKMPAHLMCHHWLHFEQHIHFVLSLIILQGHCSLGCQPR